MTTISTIHDAIQTRLAALFTSSKELENSYNASLNNELSLANGYAVAVGQGTNTNRMVSCKISIERVFDVIQTLAVRGTYRSNSIKESAEKTLLENQITLIKDFETPGKFSGSASRVRYVGDTGILPIDDETKFIMIRTSFTFEYFESTND